GRVLGRHDGIINYTVGQRRGLGIGGGEALYVVALDAAQQRVVVGPKQALARDLVRLQELNWLAGALPEAGLECSVKLRSAQEAVPARIEPAGAGGALLHLAQPQQGVAPGQAAVCYRGSRVLGGGWIASAELSQAALGAVA